MNDSEAVELIREAVHGRGGPWADLGAGEGTFTRALAELLGPGSRIYAVDRDARALGKLKRWAAGAGRDVVTVVADFTQPFELPQVGGAELDGVCLANALHYVQDAGGTLARCASWLRPGGRLVLIEYDRRGANRWVPYPITPERLSAVAASSGLSEPVVTATRASAYGGNLYVAVMERREPFR